MRVWELYEVIHYPQFGKVFHGKVGERILKRMGVLVSSILR